MKQLIIGDIHGCYRELQELLDKAGISAQDEIISLGDVVDRGPDSPGVLNFFRDNDRARTLMGNHERKHYRSYRGEITAAVSEVIAREQFGADYPAAVAWMEQLPICLELPEAILVHAFFEPGIPLEEQFATVLVGTLTGEAHLKKHYKQPWYELYDGAKPLIVGHRDYLRTGAPFIYQHKVFGLDTSCCQGSALTGLILPEFQIVSVPSHENYWWRIRQEWEGIQAAG